jgi:hypothetical protein
MKLDSLREEHILDIVKLYGQYFDPEKRVEDILFGRKAEEMLQGIKGERNRTEFRLGSKWCSNSKLEFEKYSGEVVVKFNPNFPPRNRIIAAEEAGAEFSEAVIKYLDGK